jgi:type IV secretion system protein TrbJ
MAMRKILLASSAALALLTAPLATAQAQAVVTCTNCSTFAEQALQYLVQGYQYVLQGLQYVQEVTTAEQEVVNTIRLPETLFNDATGDIRQMTGIAATASLTAGNTGNFINNLAASSYPTGILNEPMAQIVAEQNAISNAVKALGNVLNLQNPTLGNNAAVLAALNNQSMTATGRLQALQSAQGSGATTGQQLQSLQTTQLAMAQGQAATMLAEHDRLAMNDKALDILSQFNPYPMTGYKGF